MLCREKKMRRYVQKGKHLITLKKNNVLQYKKADWKEAILHIFFPRCCPICNEPLQLLGNKICNECLTNIQFVTEPRCMCCGKGVSSNRHEYCYDCRKKNHYFKEAVSLCYYAAGVEQSLAQVKYYNKRQHLDFFCEELYYRYGKKLLEWGIDVIIPVPLHKRKRRSRGFNQAEEIGKRLSILLHIPMDTNLLIRTKHTKAQKQLNDKERRNNIKDAFKVKQEEVRTIKRVLLVDDIYTTGSTVDECAKELLRAGVQTVYVATIAIGKGY